MVDQAAQARVHPRMTLARLWRTVELGFKSLWLHRLRSLLTMLGIVFGVCSVIAMLAVGEGASHEAQEQIRRLGSTNIILESLKPEEEQNVSTNRSYVIEYGLTYRDLRRIRATLPTVKVVVPGRVIRKHLWNARHRVDGQVVGTVPWYPSMRSLSMLRGRFFSDFEMGNSKNVCVLDAQAVEKLFPFEPPIGRRVRIGSDYYQVVGIIQAESGEAPANPARPGAQPRQGKAGESGLPRVYIPLSAARNRFGEVLMKRRSGSFEAERVELHQAIVQVENEEAVEEAALIIGDLLRAEHKRKDFNIIVPLELLRQAERTKQIFNIVLGAIAAISLLVGGIGIMNIMLASVTERTREIGIRRALGARRSDIISQFLIETVILSGTGGLIGVALGFLIPLAITELANMKTIITPGAPLLAFSISALVGIVFGLYPAMRAANMDPVEALRHE